MIRSVVESFNSNMSLPMYLQTLHHNHIVNKTRIAHMTLNFICWAHFMKIIVNQIKDKELEKEWELGFIPDSLYLPQ
jgi:hypothetical protein